MDQQAQCPYCGEPVTLWLDVSGGEAQSYIEDCPVCCRPWQVRVWRDEDGAFHAHLDHQDA